MSGKEAEKNLEMERKADKLQKKIESFEKELTIEAKESDLIKGYKMKEGTYQIIITVYEANQLEPRGTNFWLFKTDKTACDAFVEVEIRGETRRSKVKNDTNNPIFDEQFFFKFEDMTLEELDRSNITFRVYDKKAFILRNSLLGSFQLDWTNVYFKRNHEIYRGWLTLLDPLDEEEGIMGYLLVNIAVLGREDKVTVHDSAFIKDPLTTMEDTITMPKLMLIDYAINIQIFRAENLVPLDQITGNVDAYVIAKFSGNKIDTSLKRGDCNPHWNEMLSIGTGVPTKSKYILLQVRNSNVLGSDDIIGIIKIPFIDLEQNSEPKWGHLYGPPKSGKDHQPYNYCTKMQIYGQQMGSHYRGRLLYRITGHKDLLTTNKRTKIKFQFPFKPTPVVATKAYTLRVEVLDGFNLPEIGSKGNSYIHVCIGQYLLATEPCNPPQNGAVYYAERLPDKKVQLPEDPKQIPDLIIYFAKGKKEADRISYIRIPGQSIIAARVTNPMGICELKGDFSLNHIKKDDPAGYLTLRAHLFTGLPEAVSGKLSYQFGRKQKFILKIFVYRARNLPPMNDNGDCDAKLVFNFSGTEETIKSQYSTYNPIWNKVITMEIESEDIFKNDLEKALICNVYDEDEGFRGIKNNLIGECLVKISRKMNRKFRITYSKKIDFIYCKPKWYPIINKKVDVGDPCFGHLLMGCALFRKTHEKELNTQPIEDKVNMIKEISEKKTIQFYVLGARNLEATKKFLSSETLHFEIRVGKHGPISTDPTEVKMGCSYINQMRVFHIDVPKNKNLVPFVDFKLMQNGVFMGFTSANLYEVLPVIFDDKVEEEEEEEEEESSETIIDVDELERQLKVVRERRRRREALKNQKNLGEDKFMKPVQKLAVPSQLGPTVESTEDSEKNEQLNEIYENYMDDYEKDEKYNYVRTLQKQMDLKQKEATESIRSSKKLSSRISEQNEAEQEEDMLNPPPKKPQLILEEPNQSAKPFKRVADKKIQPRQGDDSENEDVIQHQMPEEHSEKKESSRSQDIEEEMKKQIIYNNDEKSRRDDYMNLLTRFLTDSEIIRKHVSNDEDKTISNMDINPNDQLEDVPHDDRAIKYKDLERYIKQEQKFTKQALERQENYRYAAAVKLSLFDSKNKKEDKDKQTYQDFDTDPGEDLDIIPEWYKGRKILATDFQELVPNKKIWTLPIFQGGNKIANLDIREKKKVGVVKFVPLAISQEIQKEKEKKYLKLLKPRSYICRIYVLKGKSLISTFYVKPTTYLRMTCRDDVFNLKPKTMNKENYNPEYYICQEIPMEIPGPSTVKIEVMEQHPNLGSIPGSEKVLGFTEIDIQQRQFTKKWHYFLQKKPIELRNLYSDYGVGTQGRLQVWVDLIEKKDWLNNPPYKIHPPPFDEYELRVIVWSTKDCVYKNEAFQSNDVYVRGFLGTGQPQETDTHWACRSVGNFNYRFKFPVSYPPKPEDMYSDQFIVQIWDRDLIGYNNLIGEKRINLNKIHRIIEKAVKRKTNARAKMRIREKGLALTEKFWFDVFNHRAKDEFGQQVTQGKVQLSFQLVPTKMAEEELKNGYGRSSPNMHPTLQDPEGRLSFSFFHPLDFFKQLCGPELYNSICRKLLCCLLIIIILVLGYFCIGQIIAVAIIPG